MIFNQSLKNTEAENHYTDLSLSLYLNAEMIFPASVAESPSCFKKTSSPLTRFYTW